LRVHSLFGEPRQVAARYGVGLPMQTVKGCRLDWDNAGGILSVRDSENDLVLQIVGLRTMGIRCRLDDGCITLEGPFRRSSFPKERPPAPDWQPESFK